METATMIAVLQAFRVATEGTDGAFYNLGGYGFWWSSSKVSLHRDDWKSDYNVAWYRYLFYHSGKVYRNDWSKSCGYSVRCLKD